MYCVSVYRLHLVPYYVSVTALVQGDHIPQAALGCSSLYLLS